MNTRKAVASAVVALIVLGGGAALKAAFSFRDQPLPFSHKKHVGMGIACESCHIGVTSQDRATIPETQVCALCHGRGKDGPKTPPELAAYIKENKQIPWKTVYRLPGHVHFSHMRHVAVGGLNCLSCHGDMARMEAPLSDQPVPLKMTRCLSCHWKEKVSTDCLSCHR